MLRCANIFLVVVIIIILLMINLCVIFFVCLGLTMSTRTWFCFSYKYRHVYCEGQTLFVYTDSFTHISEMWSRTTNASYGDYYTAYHWNRFQYSTHYLIYLLWYYFCNFDRMVNYLIKMIFITCELIAIYFWKCEYSMRRKNWQQSSQSNQVSILIEIKLPFIQKMMKVFSRTI